MSASALEGPGCATLQSCLVAAYCATLWAVPSRITFACRVLGTNGRHNLDIPSFCGPQQRSVWGLEFMMRLHDCATAERGSLCPLLCAYPVGSTSSIPLVACRIAQGSTGLHVRASLKAS